MYNDSLYDSPSIDMLDYGDNTGCDQLLVESGYGYEYQNDAYIYQDEQSVFW